MHDTENECLLKNGVPIVKTKETLMLEFKQVPSLYKHHCKSRWFLKFCTLVASLALYPSSGLAVHLVEGFLNFLVFVCFLLQKFT